MSYVLMRWLSLFFWFVFMRVWFMTCACVTCDSNMAQCYEHAIDNQFYNFSLLNCKWLPLLWQSCWHYSILQKISAWISSYTQFCLLLTSNRTGWNAPQRRAAGAHKPLLKKLIGDVFVCEICSQGTAVNCYLPNFTCASFDDCCLVSFSFRLTCLFFFW